MFRLQRNRKGFTLIELLVVVAIIAILAAILFPVFARVKRSAQRTACLNNLKQIGTAINMYMQDYDETFPKACGMGPALHGMQVSPLLWAKSAQPSMLFFGDAYNAGTIRFYPNLIAPYVKNNKIFQCPSAPEDGKWYLNASVSVDMRMNYILNGAYASFGINSSVVNPDDDPPTTYMFNAWVFNSNNHTAGGGIIEISGSPESICVAPADAPIAWDIISGRPSPGSNPPKAQLAHGNIINVLYVDGHASSVKINEQDSNYTGMTNGWNHFWAYGGHTGWQQ